MWDYDKLFAEDNVVILKRIHDNSTFPSIVTHRTYWGNNGYVNWYDYLNNSLSFRNDEVGFEIQSIVRLDEHGNVIEKLFDRDRDMPKLMPKLETGMFVRVYSQITKTHALAIVYEDRIIYQTGEWDDICDVLSEDDLNTIVEIYPSHVLCFDGCFKENAIWSRFKN